MSLPQVIEVVPVQAPVRARIAVPGSKSITNRALVLAALAEGETVLTGALWSEDTRVMVDCLRDLGYMVNVTVDPAEPGNRTITVYGQAAVPHGGSAEQPLELFVGNAGTAARFLAAMVCLGKGVYRLHGVPRMHERPQAELFRALREIGCRIDAPGDRLPAIIHTTGPRPGTCRVSMKSSSQFASALLLAARKAGWEVQVEGENEDEAPYVTMTREMVKVFPQAGGTFAVEPDASSASYFLAADHLLGAKFGWVRGACVRLTASPQTSWQVDSRFATFLPLPEVVSRRTDLGDSILTAMVLAPFAEHAVRFTDLGRLRVQECERVVAMRTELTRCGARVEEQGDTLTIYPSHGSLRGSEIETYEDHRIAMCFGVLGLAVSGVSIRNPACARKTFPNFFQKLAWTPPQGLGVRILNAENGLPCGMEDLVAEMEMER